VTDLVDVAIEERDGVVVARVTGELDIAGAPRTGDEIADAVPTTARGLVIDFSGLDFIDSSGVAMLFAIARRLAGRRQQLRVVAPDGGPVTRVLDIVEFGKAAPVLAELDKALAEFN
jgi:anti-anti-sigma factor